MRWLAQGYCASGAPVDPARHGIDTVAHVPDNDVWKEWKRITRFLESGRVAFARERSLWESLQIDASDEVTLVIPPGRYRVSLAEHLEALSDEQTFYASVLLHSYAVTESAALEHLGEKNGSVGGIEDWGQKLLDANGKDWPSSKVDAVEVAVVRHAFAHSNLVLDRSQHNRLTAAGETTRTVGSPIAISYDDLVEYRDRLKMILRNGGLG